MSNVYTPKNNKIKQKEIKEENNNKDNNNLLTMKISDLEKELSNQKIKNEELKKDLSAFNVEKQEFITQIQNLQNELNNKSDMTSKVEENNNNNFVGGKTNKEKEKIETDDIESIKNENMNLKNEILKLNENIKELNQELDAYEKEALESEQEVNMLKETNNNLTLIRDQLMQELETLKNNTNTNNINQFNQEENKINEANKDIKDINKLFTKKLKSYVDKTIFKNKIQLYIDLLSTHKMESLIIENTKLNGERMELNQKVEILTELINNPESMSKYVDENGNINIPYEITDDNNNLYEKDNEHQNETDNNNNENNDNEKA